MKDIIAILRQAQACDVSIFSLQQVLKEIPGHVADLEKRFEGEKQSLQRMEDRAKETKLQMKKTEGELKSKEEQIKKYEAQLVQVKTNKEYASLQGEIALIKKECSGIEEKIILFLDEIAAVEKDIIIERQKLEQRKHELESEKKRYAAEEKENTSKIVQLTADRERILAPLDPQVKKTYEKIVTKRQGNALAKIEQENCGACSIKIRPQIINEVRMGEHIVVCESCSRILYVESE